HDALILLLIIVANHPVSWVHSRRNLLDALHELVLERIREDHGATDSPTLRPTTRDRSRQLSASTSTDGHQCRPRNTAARRTDTSPAYSRSPRPRAQPARRVHPRPAHAPSPSARSACPRSSAQPRQYFRRPR